MNIFSSKKGTPVDNLIEGIIKCSSSKAIIAIYDGWTHKPQNPNYLVNCNIVLMPPTDGEVFDNMIKVTFPQEHKFYIVKEIAHRLSAQKIIKFYTKNEAFAKYLLATIDDAKCGEIQVLDNDVLYKFEKLSLNWAHNNIIKTEILEDKKFLVFHTYKKFDWRNTAYLDIYESGSKKLYVLNHQGKTTKIKVEEGVLDITPTQELMSDITLINEMLSVQNDLKYVLDPAKTKASM